MREVRSVLAGARRLRWRCWSGVLLALAATIPHAVAAEPPRRPNFVFVYTDDQRWDAMGVVQREQGDAARFPWLRTPNFDRMAQEGVRFRNAFVVNSLCSPSRASFLTGAYGHRNGIVNNHTPFDGNTLTYARLLREAGYRTGYVGKFHMGAQHGPRPGFHFSASFVGQGRYNDCPFEVDGKETPTKGWVDDVSTDYALQFLRENRAKPFLLVVGLKSAHGPFTPPARLAQAYDGEQARAVPNLDQAPGYAPPASAGASPARPPGPAPTNLNYFRCITAADENLGKILDELDRQKLTEDTVVVFTSDNGFYLGEHRLGDKRSAYDESLRIPLLLRYPRLGRVGTVDALALNVDLAPTFLEMAGVQIPASVQGKSWVRLLKDEKASTRDAFFYAYFFESGFRVPTVTAVRTPTAKLIRYPGHEDWTEVFDLSADPYETRNLARSPEHAALRKELEAAYERTKAEVDFRIPDFADKPGSDVPRPPRNAWVLDYRFDHDEGDRVVDASASHNDGKATKAPVTAGREGRRARQFDGEGVIDVPRTPSLDPAVGAWTVEVALRGRVADAVILSSGGRSNGYALHLVQGKPALTVVTRGQTVTLEGPDSILDRWVTLTARLGPGRNARLLLDGHVVAEGPLRDTLSTPNDATQIGGDGGSPVLNTPSSPRFHGLIESIRIYSGLMK